MRTTSLQKIIFCTGRRALLFLAVLAAAPLPAATYYVATYGSDSNSGMSTNVSGAFATPQKAVTLSTLAAGDTIYIRGGTYAMSTQVKPGKAGTAGNPIKLWAHPGERPVFDFATMPSGTTKALDSRKDYWHIKGIEVQNAPDSGILIAGNGTIIEGCVVHDCKNDGFIFGSTSIRATNALILNCDSYRNYGGGDGNNGDGFGTKAGCGPGNVFRGCRAWSNSDDGWDGYDNVTNSVVFQNCWSFANGYDLWGYGAGWSGNGNGFKLGGASTDAEHRLTNCVAFGNRSKGFDHNNSHGGLTIVNCTGYSNNVNFSFFDTPTGGTLLHHVLINNAAFTGTPANLAANTVQLSNSWQSLTVSAADFASLDAALALAPRNADYTLPTNNFLRLAAGSALRDRGVNVGLPFNGAAPDLGAFEFTAAAQPASTLSAPHWTNGAVRFQVNGLTSHGSVLIHASSNLANWSPIFTSAPVTGSLQFTDPPASGLPRQFYRAEEK